MPSTWNVPSVESLRGRDLLSLEELTRDEFTGLLQSARELKNAWKAGERPRPLQHKTLAMIFEKPSLRTRSTFDIGMFQLGGHSVLLSQDFISLGKRESVRDVASNLERWFDGIMARTFRHETLTELAQHADIPVINGLSDALHPCQLLADYLTLTEVFGELQGLRITFVGDGNNVCNSHIYAAMHAGTELTIACPEGFEPDPEVLARARERGASVHISHEPRQAIVDADVLHTDVWISMGQEEDTERRRQAFRGYTVTPEWFDDLSARGIFMHDLPAHYGEEVVEEAVYHARSRVFDQAENRLHAQKAVLLAVMGSEA